MAITQLTDIFDPEVVADLTTDILFEKALLLNSPAVADGTPAIYRDGGNTVTFPSWDTDKSGLMKDQVSTRDGVTPSKVTMDSYDEAVIDKIISFDVNKHVLQDVIASANPNQHMAELVANETRQEIQRNLIVKAEATPLVHSVYDEASDNTLSVDSILRAKMTWGENAAGIIPMLFVHSAQYADLASSSDFKNMGTATTNNALVNAAAQQGAVASVHGCLIMLLDTITKKGGTLESITRSGNVATATFEAAHNFKVGDTLAISGATQSEYNGVKTVVAVPTPTTLTFAVTGSPTTPATGEIEVATRYESLLTLPDALWFVFKQGLETAQHRHAGSPVITNDFDFRYVTTLRRVAPRRVVRFSTR